MSPAETNLQVLVNSMRPELLEKDFAFCTGVLPEVLKELNPICTFREQEGLTAIVPLAEAKQKGISYQFPCRQITLRVHSSLDAVGFLAAVTARLAAHGISVNPVSAYYHDHLFVPSERAKEALELLLELTQR